MLLTGWFEADFTLPVEPCVSVPGVHFQDRLEFSAATIDVALHEGHGNLPLLRCSCAFLAQTVRAVPGGGSCYRFRASFAATCAEEAFALHGGLWTHLLSGPWKVLRHPTLTSPQTSSPAR